MQVYLLTFVLTSCFTLLGTIAIFMKVSYNLGSENEVRAFRKLIGTFAIYLIIDTIWAIVVYENICKTFIMTHILTILDTSLMCLIPYYWFVYIEEFLKFNMKSHNLPRRILQGVIGVYIALIATSFKTSFIYNVKWVENRWIVYSGEYSTTIMLLIFALFIGGAIVHGIIGYFTHKTKSMKKRSLMVCGYSMPMVIGLFVYYKYMAALCFMPSIFTSFLLFFLMIQDDMIFVDNLTGLFNRKKLIDIEDEKYFGFSNKDVVILYYIDVDKFKMINDTYGHYEGDQALRLVGKALRKIEADYNALAIRVGGDEFIVGVRKSYIGSIDMKDAIRTAITNEIEQKNLPYELNVSIGKVECNDQKISLSKYIKLADNEMYKDKRSKQKEELR